MRILQANCAKTLATCHAALEAALEEDIGLVCFQEPFIGKRSQKFTHGAFQIYWPEIDNERQKETRVAIAIRKDLLNSFIWEERSDLVRHSHIQILDIWELSKSREKRRKTRVINIYDQNIQRNERITRPIKETQWERVLQGRVIFLGDFNARSQLWDPNGKGENAKDLEEIIEKFGLILNNDTRVFTREQGKSKSVIDLAFTTPQLGLLETWITLEESQIPSDHKAILLEFQEIQDPQKYQKTQGEVTGWRLDSIPEEIEERMAREWYSRAENRPQYLSTTQDLEDEAIWIQETLVEILDSHVPRVRITPFSKRWWNQEIKDARGIYARTRRLFSRGQYSWENVRQTRNSYYTTIRREKRRIWQRYLEGRDQEQGQELEKGEKKEDPNQVANRCWQALRYLRPKDPSHTPALRIKDGNQIRQISTIEEKEQIFLAQAFPRQEERQKRDQRLDQSRNSRQQQQTYFPREEEIEKALFQQSIKRAPGISRLNAKALRLLWSWDRTRIVKLVQKCIQLGYQPKGWKTAKGIILRKPNKKDYTIPKAYRVISLLECLGKVVEKVVAEEVTSFCEKNHIFYKGQFGSRKGRGTSDALFSLVGFIEKTWRKKGVAGAIFMDVKGAFDRVSQETLIKALEDTGIDQNLVEWVSSFLSNRTAQLVIDGFTCPLRDISAGLPQGSPLSPVLFIIYLQPLLKEIDSLLLDGINLSFVDDIGIVVKGENVEEVTKRLEEIGTQIVNLGNQYQISFDEEKTEAILFTKKQKELQKIRDLQIQLPNYTCRFQKEATRWLGYWLDSKLSFREHFQTRYQKAEKVLKIIAPLAKLNGLPSGLVRKIQIAVIQSIALFGSEIWWEGQRNYQEKIQKLLNKQARAITGLFRTTPIPFLRKAADLPEAGKLLDQRRLGFISRCLRQPEGHPSRSLLPASLRFGEFEDPNTQLSSHYLEWVEKEKGGEIGKRLARALKKNLPISLEDGIEFYFEWKKPDTFPGQIKILEEEQAKLLARSYEETAIYTDGSRIKDDYTGAGLAWKTQGSWKEKSFYLGRNKVVLDAELFAISKAIDIALSRQGPTTIFSDAQSALEMIQEGRSWPVAIQDIWEKAEKLQRKGIPISLYWTPAHEGTIGNERADRAAKRGAQRQGKNADPTTSLLFIKERLTKLKNKGREKIPPILGNAPKALSARLLQLRCGHAAIGSYQKRFRKKETEECKCGARRENVQHLILRCKRWGEQRKKLMREVAQEGIYISQRLDKEDLRVILEDKKLIEPLLSFLKETEIGLIGKKEEGEWLDKWDIQLLDPGGEGGEEGEGREE
jgi:ribonuclease HI